MSRALNRRSMINGITAGAVALSIGSTASAQSGDASDHLRQFIDLAYGHPEPTMIDSVVDEIIAENWTPEDPRDDPGREALKARLLAGNEVFLVLWQEWTVTIDEVFGNANRTAGRFTVNGVGYDGTRSSLPMTIIGHAKDGTLTQVWTGTGSLIESPEATPIAQ